jgi:hypothetical protein
MSLMNALALVVLYARAGSPKVEPARSVGPVGEPNTLTP